MGNSNSAQEIEPEANNENAKHSRGQSFGKFYSTDFREKTCSKTFYKVLFVIIGVLTIIQSIVVIAVSVASAIASKLFNQEQSSRLVAMIIIAAAAAVTLSVVIYGLTAVFKKRKKPIHATAAVMIIMVILQSVVLGVSMKVTEEDEILLSRSLVDSFRLAREDNPRHMKLWATTQSDLRCCGVYSPEDYRRSNVPNYFAPDVPISCCMGYDSNRSELVQERARESCKARRQYHDIGCKAPVMEMFKFTCTLELITTIVLIILEILLAVTGVLHLKGKEPVKEDIQEPVAPTPMPRASLGLVKTKSVN